MIDFITKTRGELTVVARGVLTGICLFFGFLFCMEAQAQDEDGFVHFKVLSPKIALQLAKATLDNCHEQGYQVGVSVVDRTGLEQVFLRDRFAGAHTREMAYRKAWTAVSFRTSTLELSELTQDGDLSGIRFVTNVVAVGGGLPILSAGELVGGIGVSGAPGGDLDEGCARTAIETIVDILDF